jgi:hypothetical protein
MDAIRAFAGEEPDLAVVEPEARAILDEFDEKVRHHEVVAGPGLQRDPKRRPFRPSTRRFANG